MRRGMDQVVGYKNGREQSKYKSLNKSSKRRQQNKWNGNQELSREHQSRDDNDHHLPSQNVSKQTSGQRNDFHNVPQNFENSQEKIDPHIQEVGNGLFAS